MANAPLTIPNIMGWVVPTIHTQMTAALFKGLKRGDYLKWLKYICKSFLGWMVTI